MENKINIVELLKDCPKGTKLYSPLVGECTLEHIHGELKKILISTSDGTTLTFNNNGTYFQIGNSECLLFPSKDQRDWSKFQRHFKDGDILISGLEDNPFIFKRINGLGNAQCYCAISCFGQLILNDDNWTYIKGCRLATEEEKSKLFQAIKDNGYKWNAETKTLEKLPKFKVGDKIVKKDGISVPILITGVGDTYYWFPTKNSIKVLPIAEQDDWELVPHKFDVTTLKPFDKVLTRANDNENWVCNLYSHHIKDYYVVLNTELVRQCIPYEQNKHLLNTSNNCNDFYKTWE